MFTRTVVREKNPRRLRRPRLLVHANLSCHGAAAARSHSPALRYSRAQLMQDGEDDARAR